MYFAQNPSSLEQTSVLREETRTPRDGDPDLHRDRILCWNGRDVLVRTIDVDVFQAIV